MAEREGFEPSIAFAIPLFESGQFNHSCTSPHCGDTPAFLIVSDEEYTKSMEDSVFTKIINGEIPSHKIYEDEHTYAFLDIHPANEGHTLVIPKKQVEFLWDLDEDTYTHLMTAVKKVGQHLRSRLNYPYVGVQVVGIDVPHAHVHVIPFETVEQYRNKPDMNAEPDHPALAELARKLAL